MPVRVVIDTNILISLFINRQHEDLIDAVLDERIEIVSSREQVNEIGRVLEYSRLKKKFDENDKKMMISLVEELSIIVPLQNIIKDCRDEKDNFILEMAVFGEASYIISGDKDIQVLSPYKGISVLTLGQFKKMAGIDFAPPYPGTIPEI